MPDAEGMAKALREPAAEGVPAGAARPAGGDPVLPAQRRDAAAPSSSCSSARIEKRVAREPQGAVHLRRRACSKLIVQRCTELESGGRMIDAILTNTVLPRMSEEFLRRMMEGRAIERVHVTVEGEGFRIRL
ncbi:MAG: hypothetical protein MZV70_62740 [Desulfobacterales bacterium]|nr:hypothetical protein [Desulfobacterales bacterium]